VGMLVLFLTSRRYRPTWSVAIVLGLALIAPLTATALAERSLGWEPALDAPLPGYRPWLAAVGRNNDPAGRWMSWCEPVAAPFATDTHRAVSFLEAPGRWLDTYDSFVPARYFDYWRALTGSTQFVNPVGGQWYQDQPGDPPPNATLTDAAGVRRILAGNTCGRPPASLGWHRIDSAGSQTVWANDGAYPEAWVSHHWQQVPAGQDQLAVSGLASEPPAFAAHADQIEGAPIAGTGAAPERAQVERPSAEHLVARLQRPAGSRSYLLVAEGYDSSWHASVAGHGRKLLAANGDFQAVELKPGDEVVDIRYEPLSKTVLTPVSYGLSFALIGGVLVSLWRPRWLFARGRRKPSGTEHQGGTLG
jgi:hypothetical protein